MGGGWVGVRGGGSRDGETMLHVACRKGRTKVFDRCLTTIRPLFDYYLTTIQPLFTTLRSLLDRHLLLFDHYSTII